MSDGIKHGDWLTYRPDIKVLDCTVRDGGLINNHHFDDDFVRTVYNANVAAGVDYMEVGYKGDKALYSPSKNGPWKHCDEDSLRRIVGDNDTDLKLAVMADAERTNYKRDIPKKSESVIDLIRVACYIHQIPLALDMVKDAADKGYEVMLQLMALSTVNDRDLDMALKEATESDAGGVYIVDSFGSLYSEQIRAYTQRFLAAVKAAGKEVGIHAHNNQQLAYANTIEAIICGASRVDATFGGIGRGAGNCPMELILGFLHNPKFKMRPILECTQKIFTPLAKTMDWGYSIPYALTGQLNMHPRSAIDFRAGANPDDYVAFYDQLMEEVS
ncbi:MAG TPA: nucleoid-structuring protein H-NS [Verrucomicrobia bacterium]|nr:nucleoid-structuring protein H-NS [Verrucomicrobiota bacterium]